MTQPRRAVRALSCALLVLLASLPTAAAGDVTIVPSATGHVGAWLAVGSIPGSPKAAQAPRTLLAPMLAGVDDMDVTGRAGQIVNWARTDEEVASARPTALKWRIVSSGSGPIDLAQQLEFGAPRAEAFAYLYGVLHVEQRLSGYLLLGSSDGVRVFIDGQLAWSADGSRPQRDDEDVVPLQLPAGDHRVLLKLHHREGYWAVRTRLVDRGFESLRGVTVRLPGATELDARQLAARMVDLSIDRGLTVTGFAPTLRVAFPEGVPASTDRTVRASAMASVSGKIRCLFAVNAGQTALTASGPTPLEVRLPEITREQIDDVESGSGGLLTVSAEVAGRRLDAPLEPRAPWHEALVAADRAILQSVRSADPEVMRATLEHLREHLVRDAGALSSDVPALNEAATTLLGYADDLAAGRDPLRTHAGIRRFAYRSELDGHLSPFGVHVPRSYAQTSDSPPKTYPLVVTLHGMNGKPISMLHWTFGHDDEAHDAEWEDRRAGELSSFDGFVIAPNAFGNGMYRELGEVDVLRIVDWATRFYPIDPNRITITGVSMGGTGAASVALHYPDRFAAAMPLCGYHSYFVRRDLMGMRMRVWEQRLAEQRSNALWADNGVNLPMFVWHGKRDLPEKNSGVLIDRYLELGYDLQHEHPDVGHDVWRRAYAEGGGLAWLASQKRNPLPRRVVFRTNSPRYHDDAWMHLLEVPLDLSFAAVDGRIVSDGHVTVTTDQVGALMLDRDALGGAVPVTLTVDGTELSFAPDAAIFAYKDEHGWNAGPRPLRAPAGQSKRAGLSGPIRDIFYEPLVFVYGTQDPTMTSVNREVARSWARIRYGAEVQYPVIADDELDEKVAATHSLVLVGAASSNRIVRALEPSLPFQVRRDAIAAGRRQWRGADLGVAFVYPNPLHPERYVFVIEGTSALGTFRAIALPDLLPDYVVYGSGIAPARGQIVLGAARPLAAGLFRADWTLSTEDPAN